MGKHPGKVANCRKLPSEAELTAETAVAKNHPLTANDGSFSLAGAVVLAAVLAFLPTLRNGFVTDWDDRANFLDNTAFRGIGAVQLHWAWTARLLGVYQPLGWMLLGVQYVVFGLNPLGYHAVSVMLHAVNSILLFILIRRLLVLSFNKVNLQISISSALAATLWAIHPLRVEVVAWASCQPYLPCAALVLGSMLAYLHAHECQELKRSWYVLSLMSFMAAGLFKGTAMMLPLVLLIIDVYPLGRIRVGRRLADIWPLVENLPFALVGMSIGLAAIWAREPSHIPPAGSVVERFMHSAYGLGFYLLKTILPVGLTPYRFIPEPFGPFESEFLIAALGLCAVLIAVTKLSTRWPAVGAAWLTYAVILMPVLGFVRVSDLLVSDRYSYLATMSLFALLAATLARVPESHWRLVVITSLTVGVILSYLTWVQCGTWCNSQTLAATAL